MNILSSWQMVVIILHIRLESVFKSTSKDVICDAQYSIDLKSCYVVWLVVSGAESRQKEVLTCRKPSKQRLHSRITITKRLEQHPSTFQSIHFSIHPIPCTKSIH